MRMSLLTLGLIGCIVGGGCKTVQEMSNAMDEPRAPATNPATRPVYPVTYALPTVEQLTDTLVRIRERIERATAIRIVDSKTGKEITDFSTPNPNAGLDRGPEKRF